MQGVLRVVSPFRIMISLLSGVVFFDFFSSRLLR
jgi:hypothetical protein